MRYALLILMTFILGGCATTKPHEPFKVDREEVAEEVKSIGLMPCVIPRDIEGREEKRKEFEGYLFEKLKAAGFHVIPSSKYQEIRDPMKAAMGGLYDAQTGELLKEKNKALQQHAKREYLNQYDVDALLSCAVIVVKASWNHNNASWHGVTEASTGKKGFWAALAAPNAYGTIPALSLAVLLEDEKGDDYYMDYGGIQLLKWVRGRKFESVPAHQLLTDSERNRRAVDIALASLLGEEESDDENIDEY